MALLISTLIRIISQGGSSGAAIVSADFSVANNSQYLAVISIGGM